MMTNLVRSGEIIDISEQEIKPFYQAKVSHAVSHVREQMVDLPVNIHHPEGSLFLWLWFEGLPISCDELYQRLKTRGVYVISGHHFFPGLDEDWQHKHECIRVSYAGDDSVVETGIQMIAEEVRRAYQA